MNEAPLAKISYDYQGTAPVVNAVCMSTGITAGPISGHSPQAVKAVVLALDRNCSCSPSHQTESGELC